MYNSGSKYGNQNPYANQQPANGNPYAATGNPVSYFNETSGQQVKLQINLNPSEVSTWQDYINKFGTIVPNFQALFQELTDLSQSVTTYAPEYQTQFDGAYSQAQDFNSLINAMNSVNSEISNWIIGASAIGSMTGSLSTYLSQGAAFVLAASGLSGYRKQSGLGIIPAMAWVIGAGAAVAIVLLVDRYVNRTKPWADYIQAVVQMRQSGATQAEIQTELGTPPPAPTDIFGSLENIVSSVGSSASIITLAIAAIILVPLFMKGRGK